MEGDLDSLVTIFTGIVFLSTPSGWRATCGAGQHGSRQRAISIHALRVEGDLREVALAVGCPGDFYPRPPGGGRRLPLRVDLRARYFYPRPPGGGRLLLIASSSTSPSFLSTPSGWRATQVAIVDVSQGRISIHALRVEGDLQLPGAPLRDHRISIHALRVEGDAEIGSNIASGI